MPALDCRIDIGLHDGCSTCPRRTIGQMIAAPCHVACTVRPSLQKTFLQATPKLAGAYPTTAYDTSTKPRFRRPTRLQKSRFSFMLYSLRSSLPLTSQCDRPLCKTGPRSVMDAGWRHAPEAAAAVQAMPSRFSGMAPLLPRDRIDQTIRQDRCARGDHKPWRCRLCLRLRESASAVLHRVQAETTLRVLGQPRAAQLANTSKTAGEILTALFMVRPPNVCMPMANLSSPKTTQTGAPLCPPVVSIS